ncbi:c-type cytochrome [Candidatus Poriferisocius sp.]|uniref:c-type cytochrome n=1 Tax=Candidatus Poriferisocius sp. TaxID=3101276 RepID=UPI003B016A08
MSLSRPRWWRRLGALLLSGCLALMASGCSGGADPEQAAAPTVLQVTEPAAPGDISVGKSVYLQRCVGCHAVDGSGIVGPDIRPGKVLDKYASAEAMEVLVRYGLGEMPEFASKLNNVEIAAVVAYVRGGLG